MDQQTRSTTKICGNCGRFEVRCECRLGKRFPGAMDGVKAEQPKSETCFRCGNLLKNCVCYISVPEGDKRRIETEPVVVGKCGATQTAVDERYDLICPTGLRRLAARYALGAKKHGDFNWCKGGDDPEFQRGRLNHLIKHVNLYLLEGNSKDDNLAAIALGAFALMHYEEHCLHHLNAHEKIVHLMQQAVERMRETIEKDAARSIYQDGKAVS